MTRTHKLTLAGIIALFIIAGISVAYNLYGVQNPGVPAASPAVGMVNLSAPALLTLSTFPTGSVDVGEIEHIRWTSENYAAPTVSLNIIRKVSDNPARYELVRQVARATKNDGTAVWVPAAKDVGTGVYVEVGCALSAQACTATPLPSAPLAVVNDGRYANTAAIYQAIESESNN